MTVTVPRVGPALEASLTVIVYVPVLLRLKSKSSTGCVLVIDRLAGFTVSVAVAVLPVPPLSEVTVTLLV